MDRDRHTPPDPGALVDEGPGVGNNPLRPEERDAYRTDPAAGVDSEPTGPMGDSRGWLVIGLVLLAVFIVLLAWAVLVPAT